ncbi:hypothetical protein [Cellulomonas sp. S1-8]|uniref:hypothetical protein n=1 Tax=Cellulomonas sp. S1-8 TaxID=2904790 RepID=UPI002244E1C6|nr:hypothetical protein [Cellulomonas sp. S1-8]UZN02869.1 hypothetical protein OKX07_17725 [Cellulomonas sp. S1-8]
MTHHREQRDLSMAEPAEDEWGVPNLIFGLHPEAFWGGMGRVASLSALFEDRLLVLLTALRGEPADASPPPAMGTLLKRLEDERDARAGMAGWSDFGTYLARARRCVTYRNDLVHSVWPVQPGGLVLFGHRLRALPRDQRTEDSPAAERLVVNTTMDELRSVVAELVALTDCDFRRWFSLANTPVPPLTDRNEVG